MAPRICREKDVRNFNMICTCGALIPEGAERYPCPEHSVKKKIKGQDVITMETQIIKCANKMMHPESTEWNYIVHARLRGRPRR